MAALDYAERRIRVKQSLHSLPRLERSAIETTVLEGLSHRAAARLFKRFGQDHRTATEAWPRSDGRILGDRSALNLRIPLHLFLQRVDRSVDRRQLTLQAISPRTQHGQFALLVMATALAMVT